MDEETEKCAQIVYDIWKGGTVSQLDKLENSIEGYVGGKVVNPRNLEIYFTPRISKYRSSSDGFGVKESIEFVMKLYLEGESPIWDDWNEYREEYGNNRAWGSFREERVHTHFIPDTMLEEMLDRLQAETQYSSEKFTEFANLYSLKLQPRYPVDTDEKIRKTFNEVIIHEISHYILYKFCEKHRLDYPHVIGEAIGWFLDHKIYDDTNHSPDRSIGDLGVGHFSGYSFTEQQKKYVIWLINAMEFSYEVDRRNNCTSHPYPWSSVFISHITSKDELSKKEIFIELLPQKTKDSIDSLENLIEVEYREEYQNLKETVESTEQKIQELELKARNQEGDKNELMEKKSFYREMEDLKYRLQKETDVETPQEFEAFLEKQIQVSVNQERSFKETVEHMEQKITQHVEEQKNNIKTAVELCVEKRKEMDEKDAGEINGRKIEEREDFFDTVSKLNSMRDKLEDHLGKVQYRFNIDKN